MIRRFGNYPVERDIVQPRMDRGHFGQSEADADRERAWFAGGQRAVEKAAPVAKPRSEEHTSELQSH